jgi:integrase
MAKRQIKPLEPEQARSLIAAAEQHRLGALVTVAVALGLRQGEALGLQWADVDLDRGVIHIRHALQRIGGTWNLVEPKSERSRRTIALPRVVIAALKAHRTMQLEERLAAGEDWKDQGFVFCTKTGGPLDTSNTKRVFRALLKAADAPTIRFHDLRHTAASLLIAQGVNACAVAEILGHSSVTLTLNTYAHQLETLKHDAASRMDDILGHTPRRTLQ